MMFVSECLVGGNATHPLFAPIAIQITPGLAIYLRWASKRQVLLSLRDDFDANWLTFASHLALSVQEPSSLSVVALLSGSA
jgi:hypothetical protein